MQSYEFLLKLTDLPVVPPCYEAKARSNSSTVILCSRMPGHSMGLLAADFTKERMLSASLMLW